MKGFLIAALGLLAASIPAEACGGSVAGRARAAVRRVAVWRPHVFARPSVKLFVPAPAAIPMPMPSAKVAEPPKLATAPKAKVYVAAPKTAATVTRSRRSRGRWPRCRGCSYRCSDAGRMVVARGDSLPRQAVPLRRARVADAGPVARSEGEAMTLKKLKKTLEK